MIAQMVHSALGRRGGETVVVGSDGSRLSGHGLDSAAGALSARLLAEGVGPGDTVALPASASGEVEDVVGLVAVLYTGADFVFVETDLPGVRTSELMEVVEPSCVVGSASALSRNAAAASAAGVLTVRIEDTGAPPADLPHTPSGYCVRTSGTTGTAKVLRVDGAALENRLRWGQSVYPLGSADTVLSTSRPGFDFYVWELLAPLCFGARLVLSTELESADAAALAERCASERVTALHFFPRLLDEFCDRVAGTSEGRTLRWIFSGGAPLRTSTLEKAEAAVPDAVVFNQYGPAECCIDVSYLDCSSWPAAGRGPDVPIGAPIDDTTVEIVDPDLRPVPDGTVGEILLGGIAARTTRVLAGSAGSFTHLRTADRVRAVYRTGDFGRVDEHGRLCFAGRRDTQYKVHGARVDLAEIEQHVRDVEGVTDCVVHPAEDGRGETVIGAVVESPSLSVRECRRRLAEVLPLHAVPTRLHVRANLPRTVKHEIDRAAVLAELDERVPERPRIPDRDGGERSAVPRSALGSASIRPTSVEEKRLIRLRGLDGRPLPLVVANQIRIRGPLRVDRLERAFRELVARHSILRTTYAWRGDELMAVVHRFPADEVFNVREAAAIRGEEQIRGFMAEELRAELDGFCDPDRHSMLKALLYCHGEDLFTLLLVVDHIALDERSKSLLQRELALLYEGAPVPADPPQYDPARIRGDFPDPREVEGIAESLTPLPPRVLRSPDPVADPSTMRAGMVELELDERLSKDASAAAQHFKCTRFELLLAAFFHALKKHSGHDDVALVTMVDTRANLEDFDTIGFFQNLTLLRTRAPADAGPARTVEECKSVVRTALEHRDHPIDDITDRFREDGPHQNRCHPIWQIVFVYTAEEVEANWCFRGTEAFDVPFRNDRTNLEMLLNVAETHEGLQATLLYATGALDPAEAGRVMELWKGSLTATIAAVPGLGPVRGGDVDVEALGNISDVLHRPDPSEKSEVYRGSA